MKFSVGIDLGTTHSALAYCALATPKRKSEVLSIPQNSQSILDTATYPLLPSSIYITHLEERVAGAESLVALNNDSKKKYSVGRFAQSMSHTVPGRVVNSAKSWLSISHFDQSAKSLPWKSNDISESDALTPKEASELILSQLIRAWELVRAEKESITQHYITLTVPASFDFAACDRTREAALAAGLPENILLLEEPQAAFYCWLESLGGASELIKTLPKLEHRPITILVIDVGGGTTDLSLFEVEYAQHMDLSPEMRRVAVSKHLLLGGDNVDYGIAALAEERFALKSPLNITQKMQLLAAARTLKEKVLSSDYSGNETLSVTGEGSSLFTNTFSCTFHSDELRTFIMEGFFPACQRTDKPDSVTETLTEFGLPYEADPAITKHIATFVEERRVDAVLFNGGMLKPESIQKRIVDSLSRWQQGESPVVLSSTDLELAVARGAAYYGMLRANREQLVQAHAPRSLWLKIPEESTTEDRYVCLLPQGAMQGEVFSITKLNLEARVNTSVAFQLFTSLSHPNAEVGDILTKYDPALVAMPASQAYLSANRVKDVYLPVHLEAELLDTGALTMSCVTNDSSTRWTLRFKLAHVEEELEESEPQESESAELSYAEQRTLEKALELLQQVFLAKGKKMESPKAILKRLEKMTHTSRKTWSALWLRELWNVLAIAITKRARSADHEAAWFQLSGYALRPGFGLRGDEFRVRELWRVFEMGMAFPKESKVYQEWLICWRRIASGLSTEQQRTLFERYYGDIHLKSDHLLETVRLCSVLDYLHSTEKEKLGVKFISLLAHSRLPREHIVASLARIADGSSLNGKHIQQVQVETIASWVSQLLSMEWSEHEKKSIARSLLRLSREEGFKSKEYLSLGKEVVDFARRVGYSEEQIEEEKQGVKNTRHSANMLKKLEEHLFGESLPAGLRITY